MTKTPHRCAIYTRKSSDEGLDQAFNTLQAQREACDAYIRSQVSEGWVSLAERYDDGGFSGGTMQRPALRRLMWGHTLRDSRLQHLVPTRYRIDRCVDKQGALCDPNKRLSAQKVDFEDGYRRPPGTHPTPSWLGISAAIITGQCGGAAGDSFRDRPVAKGAGEGAKTIS